MLLPKMHSTQSSYTVCIISSFQCSRSSPINQPKDNFRIIFRNTAIPTIPLTLYFFLTFWKGKLFKRRDRGIFNIRHLSWAVRYPTLCNSKLPVSSLNKWAFLLHQYITLCHRSIANPLTENSFQYDVFMRLVGGGFPGLLGLNYIKPLSSSHLGLAHVTRGWGYSLNVRRGAYGNTKTLIKSKEKVLRHPDSHQKKIFLTSEKQNSRNPKKDE